MVGRTAPVAAAKGLARTDRRRRSANRFRSLAPPTSPSNRESLRERRAVGRRLRSEALRRTPTTSRRSCRVWSVPGSTWNRGEKLPREIDSPRTTCPKRFPRLRPKLRPILPIKLPLYLEIYPPSLPLSLYI